MSDVRLFVEPGHYYSPIVDTEELKKSGFSELRGRDELAGVSLDFNSMEQLFDAAMHAQADLDFPEEKTSGYRYYSKNEMFSIGDARILAGMIRLHKPKRIIEVGSGFSSAVILDTLNRESDEKTSVTFIEPHTERLMGLLSDQDKRRVEIIESGIQEVPLSTFDILEAGDILFLDTTHISKTGSDVNHEVFHILPRLKSGVIVHFHDVFADFEYPDIWIFDHNRSWNELYVLRAFLMYNNAFYVKLANHALSKKHPNTIMRFYPEMINEPGGGLWIAKK